MWVVVVAQCFFCQKDADMSSGGCDLDECALRAEFWSLEDELLHPSDESARLEKQSASLLNQSMLNHGICKDNKCCTSWFGRRKHLVTWHDSSQNTGDAAAGQGLQIKTIAHHIVWFTCIQHANATHYFLNPSTNQKIPLNPLVGIRGNLSLIDNGYL